MANNKYYYRAVAWFGDNSGISGTKHIDIQDCKKELEHFMDIYLDNTIVFIGIKKYDAKTDEEFVCPQGKVDPQESKEQK